MKKTEIKYHKSAPQEIQDLMGTKKYEFISDYNSSYWANSTRIRSAPFLRDTETTRIDITTIGPNLENFIDELTDIKNSPDYLSGYLYCDGGYYSATESCYFNITTKRTPTQSEINKYESDMIKYNEELIVFKKLEKIIKNIVKEKKKVNLTIMAKNLEKQLEKINKEISVQ